MRKSERTFKAFRKPGHGQRLRWLVYSKGYSCTLEGGIRGKMKEARTWRAAKRVARSFGPGAEMVLDRCRWNKRREILDCPAPRWVDRARIQWYRIYKEG